MLVGVGIGTMGGAGGAGAWDDDPCGGVDTMPPSKRAKAGGSALSLSCCCVDS